VRRRNFIAFLGGAAVWPLAARAQQQPTKIARIGYLGFGTAVGYAHRVEALRTGLRDLGYVEGKNIVFEFRFAERIELLREAADELARSGVDIIFATSSTEVEPARQATNTIPIVFATHADPVGLGHVASLARPGGNMTGLADLQPDLATKRLALFKEALPHATRMFATKENVVAGGLMSYAPNHIDLSRRAASYIDKIIKGARPADLPVEQASKYQLVINLRTAQALGLNISEAFLLRADELIE
jgi:ABC-type uncharacterized transport system substrate-binding protein